MSPHYPSPFIPALSHTMTQPVEVGFTPLPRPNQGASRDEFCLPAGLIQILTQVALGPRGCWQYYLYLNIVSDTNGRLMDALLQVDKQKRACSGRKLSRAALSPAWLKGEASPWPSGPFSEKAQGWSSLAGHKANRQVQVNLLCLSPSCSASRGLLSHRHEPTPS